MYTEGTILNAVNGLLSAHFFKEKFKKDTKLHYLR